MTEPSCDLRATLAAALAALAHAVRDGQPRRDTARALRELAERIEQGG